MHRIDGAGHVDHQFVAEDVDALRAPTEVTAEWLNDVQENIARCIEFSQQNLIKGDYLQLFRAISYLSGRRVDSISGLREVSKETARLVFVAGYYHPGDNGGGEYFLDLNDTQSDDDGGSIIVAVDGGRWKLNDTRVVSVEQFGARVDGEHDDTDAYNRAVLNRARRGGGRIISAPGVSHISGTIYVTTGVELHLPGVILDGSGDNVIFETGYLSDDGNLSSNIQEWSTGITGNGTHVVERALIYGVETKNCRMSAQFHRFNYGSEVRSCRLRGSEYSIKSSHSWGQRYIANFVQSTMLLYDFVDWTTVEGNSFEDCDVALVIGRDQSAGELTFGGSWSCSILRNGFHRNKTGILIQVQTEGLVVVGNHFECGTSVVNARHVHGPSALINRRMKISNNHLAATMPGVIAVEFYALQDSDISGNDYVVAGAGSFNKRVILNGDSCYGNRIEVPFSPTNNKPDLSLYTLRDTNMLMQAGGSINSYQTQPTLEFWSGSGQFTFEKYRAAHRFINGLIPHCVRSGAPFMETIDTFVDTDAFGTKAPVLFSFQVGSTANTYRIAGIVSGLTVTLLNNVRLSGGEPAVVTAFDNAGKLRIEISGLPDEVNNTQGFVKVL